MKKLEGYETDTWQLTANEVEVLQGAADQWDEGKNELFLDFDKSTLLIENCDGQFFMRVFEPGEGTMRALALIQHEETERKESKSIKELNAFAEWIFDGKQGGALQMMQNYQKPKETMSQFLGRKLLPRKA